jgi:hypothetical protein
LALKIVETRFITPISAAFPSSCLTGTARRAAVKQALRLRDGNARQMLDSQPMALRKERHHGGLGNAPYRLLLAAWQPAGG